ncbi:Aminodeoxychorismate lyase [hydrothermal vent metagenome]|uniref:Aminodeoxychorismate lyase n=1 Tax=hydrothermal vent metagenome TaxID=652676 RepID=A0A3B1BKJ9_9ZZZZ
MSESVIINGEVAVNGAVSIDDRGYTLGDGLFETIPIYGGRPFMLDRHFGRMTGAAQKIGLELPLDEGRARAAIALLVERNSIETGVARLTVSRGEGGPRGYGIEGFDTPTWTLTCRPYTCLLANERDISFTLSPVSILIDPKSPLRGLKTISCMESILMLAQAKRLKADEALVFTREGHIASGAAVNIFWVKDGKLFTPSLSCGILAGVTRGIILELASQNAIESEEGMYGPETLKQADEVFVTNSLLMVVPVTTVIGLFNKPAPPGPLGPPGLGPVTEKLYSLYTGLIKA